MIIFINCRWHSYKSFIFKTGVSFINVSSINFVSVSCIFESTLLYNFFISICRNNSTHVFCYQIHQITIFSLFSIILQKSCYLAAPFKGLIPVYPWSNLVSNLVSIPTKLYPGTCNLKSKLFIILYNNTEPFFSSFNNLCF